MRGYPRERCANKTIRHFWAHALTDSRPNRYTNRMRILPAGQPIVLWMTMRQVAAVYARSTL